MLALSSSELISVSYCRLRRKRITARFILVSNERELERDWVARGGGGGGGQGRDTETKFGARN